MIPQQLSYISWLSLTPEMRQKMAALFEIPRTGESVIRVGEIMDGNIGAKQTSDGYTPLDLQVVTLEKMQAITGSKSQNFYELFGEIARDIDEYVESEQVAGSFDEENIAEALSAPAPETTNESSTVSTKNGKHAKTKKTKAK